MSRAQQFTPDEMIEALEKARGLRTQAARILGCHPVTVDVYAKRYASVKQALRYEREKFIDAAEAALYSSVISKEPWAVTFTLATISKEPWAVTFTLATIGKDRGYVRREERKLQGDEDKPIVVKNVGAAELRAGEFAFLRSIGVKPGRLGESQSDDHPSDAGAD